MMPNWAVRALLLALVLLLALPGPGSGQSVGESVASGGRGYTFMFLAYAIAWLLPFGWGASLFWRFGQIGKDLEELGSPPAGGPQRKVGEPTRE